MPSLDVDGLQFDFPATWSASKFDGWTYYRRFVEAQQGLKAVDVIAVAPDETLWLIEAKDYRRPGTPPPERLCDKLVAKLLSTLAAILPAAIHGGGVPAEQNLAHLARGVRRIRVVAYIEVPQHRSKLFNVKTDLTNLRQALRRRVRAIDPHPLVLNSATIGMAGIEWTVT